MKQQITKEQWDEINKFQKLQVINKIYHKRYKCLDPLVEDFSLLTIGQMIAFIGDDWAVYLSDMDREGRLDFSRSRIENLCDNLWEIMKVKLNCDY